MNLITIIILWVVISFLGSFFNKAKKAKSNPTDSSEPAGRTVWEDIRSFMEEQREGSQSAQGPQLPPVPVEVDSLESISKTLNNNVNSPLREDQNFSSNDVIQTSRSIRTHKNNKAVQPDYKIKTKSDLKRAVIWSEILKRRY